MSDANENIQAEPPPPPKPEGQTNEPPVSEAPSASGQPPAFENLTQDDKTMAMLAHLLGALVSFVGPLVIWLIKKDQSKFVDDQGKEALNFPITLLIGHIIGVATACVTFGLINMAVGIVAIVFGIMAALEANKGVAYRYPVNIRLIK